MLKRLMIWLLNQIQKQYRRIVALLDSGRDSSGRDSSDRDGGSQDSARSHSLTEDLTSITRSPDTKENPVRSDINIDTVAPVARRVSLAPAAPKRDQQDSKPPLLEDAISPSATDSATDSEPRPVEAPDTHRRLDATAAAVSGQESTLRTPATVSELIDPDISSESITEPASPTVETQGNYQLPVIQDLLPAIEPEDLTHTENSAGESSVVSERLLVQEGVAQEDSVEKELAQADQAQNNLAQADLEQAVIAREASTQEAVVTETVITAAVVPEAIVQGTVAQETVAREAVAEEIDPLDYSSYVERDEEVVEQAILFSFDIYESETATVAAISEPIGKELVDEELPSEEPPVEGQLIEEALSEKLLSGEAFSREALSEEVPSEELPNEDLASDELTSEELAIEQAEELPSKQVVDKLVDEQAIDKQVVDQQAVEGSSQEPLLISDRASDVLGHTLDAEADSESVVLPEVCEPEPVNPWVAAIAKKTQESAQVISTPETGSVETGPIRAEIETAAEPVKVEPVEPELAEPEPAETETKSGIVKLLFTIKPGNYHGYIAPSDGSKDILFHQKYINADIFERIERGTRVVATMKLMKGKAYATHIELDHTL